MSLVTPLAKRLKNRLVKSLVNREAEVIAAEDALVEKWPFKNSLIGVNSTPATFTRASAEIYQNVFGQYQKYSTDEAAYGVGITQHPAITNKCVNKNLKPVSADLGVTLTGTAQSGGYTSIIDDSTNLIKSVDLIANGDDNGDVIYINNTSGVRVSLNIAGTSGNTNTHTLSIEARGDGSLHYAAQYGSDKTVFSSTQYEKVTHTPSVGLDSTLVVTVEAGDECWFKYNMLTETTTAPKQLIECAGASGNVAQTDTQLPTFADQYLKSTDISNETYWIRTGGETVSGNQITFSASATSQIYSITSDITAGDKYYIHALTSSNDLSDTRLQYFATNTPNTSILSSDLAISSTPTWLTLEAQTVVGDTTPRFYLKNSTGAAAGTITVHEVQVTTCPIPTKTLETTGTAITTPQNVFPVNDCSYFFYLPRGIVDSGSQYLWDSTIDSNNYFRGVFITGANEIRILTRNGGAAAVALNLSYTPDGTPVYGVFNASSTSGKTAQLSNGSTDSDVDTADLVFDTTVQLSAFNNLASPLEGEQAQFGVFNEIVALNGAFYA